MNKKNLLLGLTAATIVSTASAVPSPTAIEKQAKSEVFSKLFDGIIVMKNSPECTIKQEVK